MSEKYETCPVCKTKWVSGCEQAIAILKRGKCIVCLVAAGERFEMDPYEFKQDEALGDE